MLQLARATRRLLFAAHAGARSLSTTQLSTLVVAEHSADSVKATLPAVTAAAKLGHVRVLVAGAAESPAVLAEARRIVGVSAASVTSRPHTHFPPTEPELCKLLSPRCDLCRRRRCSTPVTLRLSTAYRSRSPPSWCIFSGDPGRESNSVLAHDIHATLQFLPPPRPSSSPPPPPHTPAAPPMRPTSSPPAPSTPAPSSRAPLPCWAHPCSTASRLLRAPRRFRDPSTPATQSPRCGLRYARCLGRPPTRPCASTVGCLC